VRTGRAGAQLAASIRVPPGGGAFTVGEGAVWAMSDATSTLLRIDPARNAVVARIHVSPVRPPPARAQSGCPTRRRNTVSRIDPATNKVSATIHIEWPSGVAVSPGAVGIADEGGPSVERVDPAPTGLGNDPGRPGSRVLC
jgi:YVTN family beta-propeller protein